jgi:hypothetical protein
MPPGAPKGTAIAAHCLKGIDVGRPNRRWDHSNTDVLTRKKHHTKKIKKYQTHHLRRVKFSVSRPTFHHSFYREDYSVASIAFLKFKRTVHSHYQKSIEWIRIHQSRVAVEFMVACHAWDINAFAITGNTAPASQNGQWGRGNNQRRCEQA